MQTKHIEKLRLSIVAVFLGISLFGCRKLIEIDLPIDKNTSQTTFSDVATAVLAVNGIYSGMARDGYFVGESGISIRRGIMADEIQVKEGVDIEYTWDYDGSQGDFWEPAYRVFIYRINSAIEGISKSDELPNRIKTVLTGELKFSRAWIYFLLVNSYGDVPIVLTTNLDKNSTISRAPISEVYKVIEQDLLDAQMMLSDNFLESDLTTPTTQRVRPNKDAATALLSRVYLYMKRWHDAEVQSSNLIENSRFALLPQLDKVFLSDNEESIWQIQSSDKDQQGYNAPDGRYLISWDGLSEPKYTINSILLQAFEINDQRRHSWIGISPAGELFAYKYKEGWRSYNIKENSVVLRLAEQFLIRAEARAMQNKLNGDESASSDLNRIRNRAGLGNTEATNLNEMLAAIDRERQVELFLEWGDRWFNLKRRNKIDEAMSIAAQLKNVSWQSHLALLPIPWEEFKYNPSLRGHQNAGYSEQ